MNAPAALSADIAADLLDDPLESDRFTRREAGPGGLCDSGLLVSGITCAACGDILEAALRRVDGVLRAEVSAASGRARVRWDPARTRPSALIGAIRSAGYDAVPDAAAPARALRRAESRRALWRLFVAGFCAMQVMMLATPGYLAAPGDLAVDLLALLNWGQWVLTLPVLAFAAGPFFGAAWRSLRARRVGMELPVALALAVAFAASSGATFAPGGVFGHEVWYDSVTMFVAFLLGARWVEMRARHRAQEALEGALAVMPPTARRETEDGGVEIVSTLRLRPGDRVQVPLGEAFPADGRLLEGCTAADEALLTGESAPVPKAAGDALVAGSLNVGAPVRMGVERVGADTRHEAILRLVRDAAAQRPATAALADRWAGPFLWAVLLLAAAGAAAWSLIDPSRALPVALAVLVVTCPCALSLAAPATLVAAAGGLARRGVLVQRLDALEGLAGATRIFIDKTGTLTDEDAAEVRLTPLPGVADDAASLRRAAAGLARWSSHPVSQAVAAGVAEPLPMQGVQERPGCGLEGQGADGRRWQLGSAAWLGAEGDAAAWLACDGRSVARLDIEEALRPDAGEALAALRRAGLEPTLLSGDRPERVLALARRLGLAQAIAGATPQAKLDAVAAAQAAGHRVVMVGDGVNDAPVLARADVSLAMGQGALVARAQADAVVVSGCWRDVRGAHAGARRALRIVRQNLAWAAAYNAACIPLALLGWLPPWAAGLGMAASSLLVVLNSARAARPA
jgi:P-type Cu2+ transporter